MKINNERFKKLFPRLAEELEEKSGMTIIGSNPVAKKKDTSKFSGYNPDVIDFLCRCDNVKQAKEIINYLESKCEVSSDYAESLRRQLKEKGVRSFGPKKEEDYYLKNGR